VQVSCKLLAFLIFPKQTHLIESKEMFHLNLFNLLKVNQKAIKKSMPKFNFQFHINDIVHEMILS